VRSGSINISKYLLSVLHIQSTSTSTAQHDGGCYAVDLLGNFQQNPTHCTTVTPQMGEKLWDILYLLMIFHSFPFFSITKLTQEDILLSWHIVKVTWWYNSKKQGCCTNTNNVCDPKIGAKKPLFTASGVDVAVDVDVDVDVVCCLLFVVCCLLFVVCCLLFVVCCLLVVVCCLLFAVVYSGAL
jgi:hypothetical protein